LRDGLRADYFPFLHIRAALGPHTIGTQQKETRQMASPRWLARVTLPVVVGAVLVANAAVSSAITLHDQDFLAKMHGLGFVWPPQEDADVVNMGHQICIDRWNGMTADGLAQDIHNTLGPKGVNFADAAAMINLSEQMFCPY
jgi:hypothetical protein